METLDVEALFGDSVAKTSLRWYFDKDLVTLAGTGGLVTGDHGEDYEFDKTAPAKYVAHLNCGCELLFPVPPTTGELLYCRWHDDHFKCRVPGGYSLKCETCEYAQEGLGHDSTLAYRKAKAHAVGSRGQRKVKHTVFVGRYTQTSIEWKIYSPRKKEK